MAEQERQQEVPENPKLLRAVGWLHIVQRRAGQGVQSKKMSKTSWKLASLPTSTVFAFIYKAETPQSSILYGHRRFGTFSGEMARSGACTSTRHACRRLRNNASVGFPIRGSREAQM